jgi:hypothetical protein
MAVTCCLGYSEEKVAVTPSSESSSLEHLSPLVSLAAEGSVRSPQTKKLDTRTFRPFTTVGFAFRSGIGGLGLDVATPLSRKFNLRAGFDYFHYSFDFQEEGANINAAFRMGTGHASLDWFPFGGKFRLSPMVVFANNNRVHATALVPPGSTLSLSGGDYISSATDPLHGDGTVTFRKTSPGFTLGFGNLIPRKHNSHFSFPVEAGFYYVNQPRLSVNFSGSACDPNYPPEVGCSPVASDPEFQKDLNRFIARNNHNLSYASIYPVFSFGFGYTF